MTDRKRTARAQGTQGTGDDWSASPKAEPQLLETPPEAYLRARRVIDRGPRCTPASRLGYAESVYENALAIELGLRGIPFHGQAGFNVSYKGHEVGEGRMDMLIDRVLVVELKAVDRFTEVHVSQAISYLKATGLPLALLINFDVPVLMRGVKRVVLNRLQSHGAGAASAGESRGEQA